jgi:hypothetical protein
MPRILTLAWARMRHKRPNWPGLFSMVTLNCVVFSIATSSLGSIFHLHCNAPRQARLNTISR